MSSPPLARPAPRKVPSQEDTGARILIEAQRLVQVRGFNGFSYADIAAAVGVTKASLHYHFPSKAELGRRLIERYGEVFAGALQAIDASGASASARLTAYVDIYAGVLADERMCLCGMLAAEYATLPAPMQESLQTFFRANEDWLTGLLTEGQAAGDFRIQGEPREVANALTGGLEGAMLVARAQGGSARFLASARLLTTSFCPPLTKPKPGGT